MFTGTYTAIVTPFKKNGSIDYACLKRLVNLQIAAGVDGVVPVGTTGESPTLDFKEHSKVIETVIETVNGRMKIIAGTGANSTAEAVELTKHAMKAGADASLQVTPYYNKPNQEGLVRHFSAVADLGMPVVLYNIPGRTGREITVETVVRLSKHPKIVAVKEAGGSVDRVSQTLNACDITVLSGDDSMTLPMMSVGAKGTISVVSNVAPREVTELTHLALAGRWDEARRLHYKLYDLFCDLFVDTNPIPVKAALAMMGQIEEVYRLPMCSMSDKAKDKLRATMKKAGLIR